MSNISLTTLGGVRENGKNMYIAEIDGSILAMYIFFPFSRTPPSVVKLILLIFPPKLHLS